MKIVALGGGTVDESSAVEKYIVEFSGKERPRFLFLPTASGDGGHYINAVKRTYKRLGCTADALCSFALNIRPTSLKHAFQPPILSTSAGAIRCG